MSDEISKNSEKQSFMARQTQGIKNVKGEFNKIIWPSKKELLRQTATVVVTSLLIGAIVIGYDAVYELLMRGFTTLVSSKG